MRNTMKDSAGENVTFPHNGKLVENYVLKNGINRAELARKMNMATTSVYNYAGSASLQLGILWKISVAIKHNFIAELGEMMPVEFVSNREKEIQQQLEDLQKEFEKQNMELSIYKKIVDGIKGTIQS